MIITSTNRKPVGIVRNVAERSAGELGVYGAVHESFSHDDITLLTSFSTTIIDALQTVNTYSASKHPPNLLTDKILPIPKTGAETIELKVSGAEFINTSLGIRSLVLVLDDYEGILSSERAEYMRRMNRLSRKSYIPHVSIMDVDAFFATSELRAWAEERMPAAITLLPISSAPEAALKEEQARAPKVSSPPKTRPHSEIKITATVRTLGPNLIPDALIKNLHARQAADTPDQINS